MGKTTTMTEVELIVRDLQRDIFTVKELARKYKVKEDIIRNINKGRTEKARLFYNGTFPISLCIVPKTRKIWMDYKKGMSFEELMTIYDVNIHYITAAIKQYEKE